MTNSESYRDHELYVKKMATRMRNEGYKVVVTGRRVIPHAVGVEGNDLIAVVAMTFYGGMEDKTYPYGDYKRTKLRKKQLLDIGYDIVYSRYRMVKDVDTAVSNQSFIRSSLLDLKSRGYKIIELTNIPDAIALKDGVFVAAVALRSWDKKMRIRDIRNKEPEVKYVKEQGMFNKDFKEKTELFLGIGFDDVAVYMCHKRESLIPTLNGMNEYVVYKPSHMIPLKVRRRLINM